MKTTRQVAVLAVAGLGLATALAGCGGSDGGSDGGSSGGSGSGSQALSGASFTVGSKEFTESLILGNITADVLENAGADVTRKLKIQGSATTRKALTSGAIDMYWDYTGTGWVQYLKHGTTNVPSDLYQKVKTQDAKENGIAWLKPAPFQDTYAIAAKADFAKKNNISTLSDMASYVKKNGGKVCAASEFIKRSDGLPGLEKAYGFKFSDVVTLELNLVYAAVGDQCEFTEVLSTDGRIVSQDLQVLKDDKGFFVPYNGALTMREKTLKKYPKLADIFAPVSKKLTNDTVTNLNKEVSVDGKKPEDVAEDWLEEQGLID